MNNYNKILDESLVFYYVNETMAFNYNVQAENLLKNLNFKNKIIAKRRAELYQNAINEAAIEVFTHGLDFINNINITLRNHGLNYDKHAENLLLNFTIHYLDMAKFCTGLITLEKQGLEGLEGL